MAPLKETGACLLLCMDNHISLAISIDLKGGGYKIKRIELKGHSKKEGNKMENDVFNVGNEQEEGIYISCLCGERALRISLC